MDSDVTQSAFLYKAYAWGDAHKKQLLIALLIVVIVAAFAGVYLWYQGHYEEKADAALSKVTASAVTSPTPVSADAFLQVASDFPNSDAAARAILLAAGNLYTRGNYAEAKAQFDRFLRDYRSSPFAVEAQMGVAASFEALGQLDDAARVYNDISARRQNEFLGFQAKLALGRIYEAQGKLEQARASYEEVARSAQGTSISSEAAMAHESLVAKHPELIPPPEPQAPPAEMGVPFRLPESESPMTTSGPPAVGSAPSDPANQ